MVLNDRSSTDRTAEDYSRLIAIVGMAGRFPGSSNVDQFWENLVQGRETTTRFTPEELKHAGLPDWVIQDPDYVPVRGVIEEVESFDAAFFGYSPREAEILDPQQRVFLEVAYTALENAGYDPGNCPGSVGVFAGENQNSYLLFNVIDSDEALSGIHALAIHEDKDFLATRVAYKLNLKGPAVTLQCACSTSLVCTHMACQSLLDMECDMALAGGVSVVFPHAGYFYQKGGVFAPDGHCRPFDHHSQGTFGSDGAGVVVLKRLSDALRDHDTVHAVILGSAINNDGADKASFAAPSADGQAAAIVEAGGSARRHRLCRDSWNWHPVGRPGGSQCVDEGIPVIGFVAGVLHAGFAQIQHGASRSGSWCCQPHQGFSGGASWGDTADAAFRAAESRAWSIRDPFSDQCRSHRLDRQ